MHAGEFAILMGAVRFCTGRTRVGMPEEKVYFPAGILPACLGIDFSTVRDQVNFCCLSGLSIPWAVSDLAGGRPFAAHITPGVFLLKWLRFLDSCFFL